MKPKTKTMLEIAVASHLLLEQQELNDRIEKLEKGNSKPDVPHVTDAQFRKTMKTYYRQMNFAFIVSVALLAYILYVGDWS